MVGGRRVMFIHSHRVKEIDTIRVNRFIERYAVFVLGDVDER
jgi:hypothetical protein